MELQINWEAWKWMERRVTEDDVERKLILKKDYISRELGAEDKGIITRYPFL